MRIIISSIICMKTGRQTAYSNRQCIPQLDLS